MSEAITRGVKVEVVSQPIPQRSDPSEGVWMFAYQVTISNVGTEPVRLLARHWIITDANGRQQHVKGPGVIGQQPRILPGDAHTYTSGCPLPTSMGTMHGTYQMVTDEGELFDAQVAPFMLADPLDVN